MCPEISLAGSPCFYPAASLDEGIVTSPNTSRLAYTAHLHFDLILFSWTYYLSTKLGSLFHQFCFCLWHRNCKFSMYLIVCLISLFSLMVALVVNIPEARSLFNKVNQLVCFFSWPLLSLKLSGRFGFAFWFWLARLILPTSCPTILPCCLNSTFLFVLLTSAGNHRLLLHHRCQSQCLSPG